MRTRQHRAAATTRLAGRGYSFEYLASRVLVQHATFSVPGWVLTSGLETLVFGASGTQGRPSPLPCCCSGGWLPRVEPRGEQFGEVHGGAAGVALLDLGATAEAVSKHGGGRVGLADPGQENPFASGP